MAADAGDIRVDEASLQASVDAAWVESLQEQAPSSAAHLGRPWPKRFEALGRWLPRGGMLPPKTWHRRHQTILALLWLHVPIVFGYGVMRGYTLTHVALEAGAIGVLALLATFVPATRNVRACAATIGLMMSSAALVHLSGGLIEMHFHFFVMVGVLTMYEDWRPFLLAIGFVVVHHGLLGALDPASVYNHPDAVRQPWKWGGIHGAFVLAASAVSVIAWRRNEESRAQVRIVMDRLADNEAELQEAQSLAVVGSWVWSPVTNDFVCSPEMHKIFELRWPDASVDEMRERLHPADVPLVENHLRLTVDEGTPFSFEHRIMRSNGDVRWMHARGSRRIDATGKLTVHGTAHDVTDRRREQELLASAYVREQEAAAALRVADEMKNDFLRLLAHDLNNPLTVIAGVTQTLERHYGKLPAETTADLLTRARTNTDQLKAMLNDILDLERLTSGQYEPRGEPTDLLALARGVVEQTGSETSSIHVRGEPTMARVDRVMVERILDNLIRNAMKHTPVGTSVLVSVGSENGSALIVVDDEGDGIPDRLKTSIFEPFKRGETTAKGSGIGLSLVAKFAELHGGRAWVEDRVGGGASFRVRFPRSRA